MNKQIINKLYNLDNKMKLKGFPIDVLNKLNNLRLKKVIQIEQSLKSHELERENIKSLINQLEIDIKSITSNLLKFDMNIILNPEKLKGLMKTLGFKENKEVNFDTLAIISDQVNNFNEKSYIAVDQKNFELDKLKSDLNEINKKIDNIKFNSNARIITNITFIYFIEFLKNRDGNLKYKTIDVQDLYDKFIEITRYLSSDLIDFI